MLHWHRRIPTANVSKVFEGSAGSLLDTSVMTVEEAEDWIEGFVFDELILFLSDFNKREGGLSLKVKILRKRERCQCGQWRVREEVSICAT